MAGGSIGGAVLVVLLSALATQVQPPAQKGAAKSPGAAKSAAPAKGPATTAKGAAPTAKAPIPAATPSAKPADDAAKKAAILNSPQFRRAMFEFNEWLEKQPIYDSQKVAEIKSAFNISVHNMTAAEVEKLLADLESRLSALDSREAREAQAWMARYMQLLSSRQREDLMKSMPNLLTMSADDLAKEIEAIERKQDRFERERATASRFQQPVVNPWARENAAQERAYAQDHSVQMGTYYSSPYRAPGGTARPFDDVQIGPDIGFVVGPYGGLGLTFSPGRL